jgi:Ssp1 endopeptidase immunity protein Rap1a
MRWIAITSILVTAVVTTANSSEPQAAMTADDLQQLCAGEDHVSKNVCRVYILGVTQGISLGVHIATGRTKMGAPCVPLDISAEALEQTVKGRLNEQLRAIPADRSREASAFIGAALAAAYPCSKSP